MGSDANGDHVYFALGGATMSATKFWSTRRRLANVIIAVCACLLNAGLVFGFSAIYPVLVDIGAFHGACSIGTPMSQVCPNQKAILTGMFTVTSSLLNALSLPVGIILDRSGPRRTATICALSLALGCAMFGQGGEGAIGCIIYYVGFVLLGVSGPAIFNCCASFGNLFPSKKGLVTSAMVGAFDASSAVFLILSTLMAYFKISFSDVFTGYAAIPSVFAFLFCKLWPNEQVEPTDDTEEVEVSPLASLPLSQQIASLDFVLLAYWMASTMLCINFFIASAFPQMASVQPERARELASLFSTMLPLGGIVFVPINGFLIDTWGPKFCLVILWVAYMCFAVMLQAYMWTSLEIFAYIAFVMFSFCRPLFYTLGACYVGATFGFSTFGKLYGLSTCISGFTNLLGQPLNSFSDEYGYWLSNAALVFLQLPTIALPVFASKPGLVRRNSSSSVRALAHAVGVGMDDFSPSRKLSIA